MISGGTGGGRFDKTLQSMVVVVLEGHLVWWISSCSVPGFQTHINGYACRSSGRAGDSGPTFSSTGFKMVDLDNLLELVQAIPKFFEMLDPQDG